MALQPPRRPGGPPMVPPNGGGRANTIGGPPQRPAMAQPKPPIQPQQPPGFLGAMGRSAMRAPQGMQTGMPRQGPMPPQAPNKMQQAGPPAPPQEEEVQEGLNEKEKLKIESILTRANLADDMDDEELAEISGPLHSLIEKDELSMDEWIKRMNEYLDLAMQVKKAKSFPWRNASNIKYPLLTVAAMQFHSRAMPAIVNRKSVVKGKPIGYDPGGEKARKSERIGKHMTYQLVDESPNWVDDMDKLTLILPIAGAAFKEINWDTLDDLPQIDLVLPQDMIINYWADSMETARRITRRHWYYKNTIIEKQREGFFREVDIPDPQTKGKSQEEDKRHGKKFIVTGDSESIPYEVWKTQCYLDLDEDDYKEPYIVWMLKQDKTILRIEPAFDVRSVKRNNEGEIQRITPRRRFVKYDFIPSPDGGILGIGFGILLSSINESINTSFNQLTDQGTMHSTSGGFIAKGIRMKGGRLTFEPNEWKVVQSTGDDLKKGIVPLPVKDPSKVILEMAMLLMQGGKEIISINEMATGKLPGQNTPATTTITSIEEGMKLFNAIYQRIWRALNREFKILFKLNRTHITDEKYFTVLDSAGDISGVEKVTSEDYNDDGVDVMPESDPNVASDALRLLKAQQLLELIPIGAVEPSVAGQRILEALDQPRPQELLPQPKPDPKVQAIQMKAETDAKNKEKEFELKKREADMDLKFQEMENKMELQFKQQELKLKEMELKLKERELQTKMAMNFQDHQMQMQMQSQSHRQDMEFGKQSHDQKMQQAKDKEKMKPKEKPKKDE